MAISHPFGWDHRLVWSAPDPQAQERGWRPDHLLPPVDFQVCYLDQTTTGSDFSDVISLTKSVNRRDQIKGRLLADRQ